MTEPQKASPPPWFLIALCLLIAWFGYLFVDLVKAWLEAVT